MSKIKQLTDEVLMLRAGAPGKNMVAVAILLTLCALGICAFVFFGPLALAMRIALLATSGVCIVGIWMLAVAAMRGNPTSVGIVMFAMSLQLAVSILGYVLAMMQPHKNNQPSLWYTIVGIVVIASLARSRNVLLEMKRRGLWEQRFGGLGASRNLLVTGGLLYVIGYFGLFASVIAAAVGFGQQQSGEIRQADAFLRMIKAREPEVMTAMRALEPGEPEKVASAIAKVDALDQEVDSIQSGLSKDIPLFAILTTYRTAVADWRNGLVTLQGPAPDRQRVKDLFESGDKLRREAAAEFDRKYTHKGSG